MHSETNTPVKEMVELDMTVASEQQTSFLEEDLAISSSAHGELMGKYYEYQFLMTFLNEKFWYCLLSSEICNNVFGYSHLFHFVT